MRRVLQISLIALRLSLQSACAMATFFGVFKDSAFGLPPNRPLALAARSPTWVISKLSMQEATSGAALPADEPAIPNIHVNFPPFSSKSAHPSVNLPGPMH